ncbi:MAG: hypothetical protein WAT39_08965 [Planctomycetota bacterium]
MRWSLFLCALAAACSDPAPAPKATTPSPREQGPLTIEHDFGIVPHGESRQHECTLDLARLGRPYVPLRVHLDCACGRAELRIRNAAGQDRFTDASGSTANCPGPGESLVLRITLETGAKEPLDVPKTTSRGFVVLQDAGDITGTNRIQWPILLHFGIDCPFVLRPFAALDFGRVPQSRPGTLATTIRPDEAHPGAAPTAVHSTDPDVAVRLEAKDGHWLLHATCTPGTLGNHRAVVAVANTLPGYQLLLLANWKVIADLEATPVPKISFRSSLQRPQTEAEAVGQFVIVTDHDSRRAAEFTVHKVVDDAGTDLGRHFAVWLQPVPDQPRQHRLFVRYQGGLVQGVRGSIVLTKNGDQGPFLPIELVVFAHKDA